MESGAGKMEQRTHCENEGCMNLTDQIEKIENRSNSSVASIKKSKVQCQEMTLAYQPKNALPALTLNGHVFIRPGEIGALLALPGTGKTIVTEGISACGISSRLNVPCIDSFGFLFNSTGRKILLCDTERTPDDCSKTYHNIFKRLGKNPKALTEDGSKVDHFTHLVMSEIGEPEEMRKALKGYLSTGEYDLVILDGILDFTVSMLDDKDATKVIKMLRAEAVKHNCAIVATIHPNKGTDMPAGHIGAFLYRWCRAFLLIRNSADKNVKEITTDFQHAKLSHGNVSGFDPVYFTWDDQSGMMRTCEEPKGPVYKISALKQSVMELRLTGQNEIPSGTLKIKYASLTGLKEETAKKHIAKAVVDGLLIPVGTGRATKYIPASDWNLSVTHSGTDAPIYIRELYPNQINLEENTRMIPVFPNQDTRKTGNDTRMIPDNTIPESMKKQTIEYPNERSAERT
jgi:hypothetical protein